MFGLGWGEREMDVTRGNQMSKWPTQDFSLFWDFGVFTMSSQDFFSHDFGPYCDWVCIKYDIYRWQNRSAHF